MVESYNFLCRVGMHNRTAWLRDYQTHVVFRFCFHCKKEWGARLCQMTHDIQPFAANATGPHATDRRARTTTLDSP